MALIILTAVLVSIMAFLGLVTPWLLLPGLIYCVWLGSQGNKLAWQNRRWDSVNHFRKVQNLWAYWGIALFLVNGLLLAWASNADDEAERERRQQTSTSLNVPSAEDSPAPENPSAVNDDTREPPSNRTTESPIKVTTTGVKTKFGEKFNMVFAEPEVTEDGMSVNVGTAVLPDTGVSLRCEIIESGIEEIAAVECTVDASSVPNIDRETVNAIAKDYFGVAAVLPYKGNTPAEARQWVQSSIPYAIGEGRATEKWFGLVKYQLSGFPLVRFLALDARAN